MSTANITTITHIAGDEKNAFAQTLPENSFGKALSENCFLYMITPTNPNTNNAEK